MSAHLEVILLTNVPIFVDAWLLKSTTPCGELIDQVAKNPSDPSKVVVLTNGQDNARKIAAALDNYNLFGSVIQAWYAFMKPSEETSKADTNSSIVNETHGASEKKSDERVHGGHRSKKANTKPDKAEDQTGGNLHQHRKRRSSTMVGPTEVLGDVQRYESVASSKAPSLESPRRKESRSEGSLHGSEQMKEAKKAVTHSSPVDAKGNKQKRPQPLMSIHIDSLPHASPRSSNNTRIPLTANTKPASVQDKTQKLSEERKRRSSKIVDSTETADIARTEESADRRSRTSNRGSFASKDSGGRDILPGIKKEKDSSPRRKSPRCRFCRQSGHATWLCMERPEYYKVGWTTQGINPPGCQWPESCIVKVEELCAGPIIEYIETRHLHKDKMNGEEIRIMFAWLTSYVICYNCGAAGHNDTDGMCKYLQLDRPVTVEEIAHLWKPFCRRMKGIRDKVSFGKIQQHARRANQEFRDRMDAPDGRPLKCSVIKKEKPHEGCSTEATAPGEKRIKAAQSDDCEQITDEEGDED